MDKLPAQMTVIGISKPGGPEVLFGAFAPAAARRVASFGDGLLAAAPPRYTATLFRLVERDWRAWLSLP